MSKKKSANTGGIVYSTDPAFIPNVDEQPVQETLAPGEQKMQLSLDTKQRAGKAVTLVKGFAGSRNDLEDLGKQLKSFCGTGGSVKDGEIIIQGDQRDKVIQWLIKNGYKRTKGK